MIEAQPSKTFDLLWLDAIYIDGQKRQDVVPATVQVSDFAQAEPNAPREFAPVAPRRIAVRDLYALAAREPLVAQALQATLLAVRRVDEMHAQWLRLKAQLPALLADAAAKRTAATQARQAANRDRWRADMVQRLDAELATLAAEQQRLAALPELDPERLNLPAIEQRISDATQERAAAVLTALDDEAAAVAAESAAVASEAAATEADAAVETLRGQIAAVEV